MSIFADAIHAEYFTRKIKTRDLFAAVIGPLVHPRHHEKVCGYRAIAEADGANSANSRALAAA